MGETSRDPVFVGIDVGTGSVRAAIFDERGARLGMGVHPIALFRPREDFVEQSSEDIWRACGLALADALREAGLSGPGSARVLGLGFDATCSLVATDERGAPVSVSPTGKDDQNVIVWMDHRAVLEAAAINAGRHEVLQYVGGTISPEMQMPKLLWLKKHLRPSFARAAHFFDLPDFLSYRATGVDARSLCTTVCKWTYLGHEGDEGRWNESFFREIGMEELADEGFRRIGQRVRPMGERAGVLTQAAARDLGLPAGIPVGISIIDAHAGGLGLIGVTEGETEPASIDLETRVALIGGTSTCHMAVSTLPKFIPGVWGPYKSAMIPGMWLSEGGQSATGALIDHTIESHAEAAALREEAERTGRSVYELLNVALDRLVDGEKTRFPAELASDLHVLPDHHGNRSPRADPTLRGMVSGLKLTQGRGALALLYLATIQGIAHGTRHIVDAMNAKGYRIRTIVACGGDTKNPVFVREHADATGCRIVLPREPEAVLLGAAMLGAVAAGRYPSLVAAMSAMSHAGTVVEPSGGDVARYHEAKHRVFLRMHHDQLAYRALMSESG